MFLFSFILQFLKKSYLNSSMTSVCKSPMKIIKMKHYFVQEKNVYNILLSVKMSGYEMIW